MLKHEIPHIAFICCILFNTIDYACIVGDTYSVFTQSDYRYDYTWVQPTGSSVEFRVRTCNDGHILLSSSLLDVADGYEIVLGGYDNTRSDIRRGSHGTILLQVETPDIMNCDEFLPFWVRWGSGSVEVGSGRLDGHLIMQVYDAEQPHIQALTVTSWISAPAEYQFLQSYGRILHLLSVPTEIME